MSSTRSPHSPSNRAPWVLVVDDEEPMRRLIVNAISSDKLEVVTASDGEAALRLVEGRKEEPLLTMVDVLMPGMDGLSLARKLGAMLKRGKIAIMSGHLSDVSWWPADLREFTFIAKPFHLTVLDELLREARLRYGETN